MSPFTYCFFPTVLTCPGSWPDLDEQPTDDSILRREQIKCRVAEIEAVVDAMRKLSKGEPLECYSCNKDSIHWDRWKYLDTRRPVLAGHSLGGGAAVSTMISSHCND